MDFIMKDGIVEYLLQFKLISKSRKALCQEQDDSEPDDIIYLDFGKAFYKVPHRRLMKKMEALGITGNILNFFLQLYKQFVRCHLEFAVLS